VRVLVDDDPAHPPVSVAMLMAASDCLITDFSSAWSDYLLLDRPVFIHWPDHAIWTEAGDLPLTPAEDWFPGPLTTTTDQLVSQLDLFADGRDEWRERRAWLRSELHSYVDTDNTSRLLDAIGVPAKGRRSAG
jgi:CDP-glycerol glycerophosphotransferase (TagB/SpsB family)